MIDLNAQTNNKSFVGMIAQIRAALRTRTNVQRAKDQVAIGKGEMIEIVANTAVHPREVMLITGNVVTTVPVVSAAMRAAVMDMPTETDNADMCVVEMMTNQTLIGLTPM